jgi:hypothetical protein
MRVARFDDVLAVKKYMPACGNLKQVDTAQQRRLA